jgi:SAM-dependent methyltransferase
VSTPDTHGAAPASRHRDPALYALLHTGTPGDMAFYLEHTAGAARVLELGCGHGRLLLPLARAGHEVVGLDCDAGLLGLAAAAVARLPRTVRARITLERGDMRRFALAPRFDRVLIPYSGLYCLASEAEMIACLRAAAAHLAPGGAMVLDAYAIDGYHAEAAPDDPGADEAEPVATLSWRGEVYDVLERSDWDRDGQRLIAHYHYRPRGDGTHFHDTITHRYLLTGQLAELCAAAGLRLAAAWGDFHGAPLGPDSEHMACILQPAA